MGKLLFASSSLIFFIFFLCVTKLATSQSPLLTQFCHKHLQDPNFCLKVVGSDPRSKTAQSANDLEMLTIDLGLTFARALTNKCLSLLQSEKDPQIKAALGNCAGAYSLLKSDFDNIRAVVQSGRPIGPDGLGVKVAIAKCNEDFDEKKLTSPLAKDNDNLLKVLLIIIANAVQTF